MNCAVQYSILQRFPKNGPCKTAFKKNILIKRHRGDIGGSADWSTIQLNIYKSNCFVYTNLPFLYFLYVFDYLCYWKIHKRKMAKICFLAYSILSQKFGKYQVIFITFSVRLFAMPSLQIVAVGQSLYSAFIKMFYFLVF